jgi:hypothetical protein
MEINPIAQQGTAPARDQGSTTEIPPTDLGENQIPGDPPLSRLARLTPSRVLHYLKERRRSVGRLGDVLTVVTKAILGGTAPIDTQSMLVDLDHPASQHITSNPYVLKMMLT